MTLSKWTNALWQRGQVMPFAIPTQCYVLMSYAVNAKDLTQQIWRIGSEAVDLALQAAMIHTGRRALLSLEGSYHGNSLAGLSIGASDNRDRVKNLLPHCGKIAPPLDAKAQRRIEQRLKRRDVAAFVMEPISINLGVLIPEKDAIRRVHDLCRRYGTLFIADEVACGFGRTGRLFASEHFDLEPDMLCVAKAMSGGLAPIGAVIATTPIATSMEENDGPFTPPTAGIRAASPSRSQPCASSRRTGRGCSPALRT